MLDRYTNPNPELQPYIVRAHEIRAATFRGLLRRIARALAPAELRRRLACRRTRMRAIRDLRALNDRQLKDIGVGRGEIAYRVTAALPAGCK